jgi:hypothetical protein
MMFRRKERSLNNVHIKLRIATGVVTRYCGRENAVKLLEGELPVIGKTSSLNTYDDVIQKAETTSISHSPELWYHHGCSTFAISPNMFIDIGHKTDQLEFKIVDQWFSVETTDSQVCIFFAPIKHMYEIIENGHLGYVGIESIESEVKKPGDFPWIAGIHQSLDGGLTNKGYNGITAIYTNEAVQMIVNTIYDGGEHPMIRDD